MLEAVARVGEVLGGEKEMFNGRSSADEVVGAQHCSLNRGVTAAQHWF